MPEVVTIHHGRALRGFALAVGTLGHLIFFLAVLSMMLGIYLGLSNGAGTLTGLTALAVNLLLIIQFPIVHSLLLTRRGNRFLKSLSPKKIATDMTTTWFALIASSQLLLLFRLWSPSGTTIFEFRGICRVASNILYALSWLYLLQAMYDADITLQSGLKGWWAVVKNVRPRFADFPRSRTFAVCRQPIYLAFALILWTAPVWTWDRLSLASVWTAYCVFGPRMKETRYIRHFGARYQEYMARVPYIVPLPFKLRKR